MRLLRRNKKLNIGLCGLLICQSLVGCIHGPDVAKIAYLGSKPLTHYEDVATEITYPTESGPHHAKPDLSRPPRMIYDINEDTVWDLTLNEVIVTALQNAATIRDDGSFGSPANPLLANPNGARSAYDIAILESGILFGNRGVEAALADFDAQLTTTMTWGRSELIQNAPFLNLAGGSVLTEESAQFSTQLRKQLANSGIFTVQHDMNYSGNNVSSRLFPSAYTGLVRAEYRQPLLAGSGTEFTRIAGPIGTNLQGVSGVAQGVLISRINTDIAIADLDSALGSMLRDVQNRYWDLHLAYLVYDAERVAAGDALQYYNDIKNRIDVGEEQIAQAVTTYYESVTRVENSLADINENETRLRRLMGLPPRDDKIIRPVDNPSEADFAPDWRVSVAEALSMRPEVRSQKWNIKSLELQLKAARNLVRPRFDFVAQYQVNAFGDQLFGDGDATGARSFVNDSAYESLSSNETSTWNIGFQLAAPLGLRTAHTQVRNYEFRLRKARALLATQEMEIGHELNSAFQLLDRWHRSTITNRERVEWARRNLELAVQALEQDKNPNTQSRLVQAHINLRESQIAYHRSVIEYNKAMTELHFRKGTLLAESNVHLSEGLWCPSAYTEALKRAWARSYAWDADHKHTEPAEFVARKGRAIPVMSARPAEQPAPPTEEAPMQPYEPPAVPPEGMEPTGFVPPVVEPFQQPRATAATAAVQQTSYTAAAPAPASDFDPGSVEPAGRRTGASKPR